MGRKTLEGGARVNLRRMVVISCLLIGSILNLNPNVIQLERVPSYQQQSEYLPLTFDGIWSHLVKTEEFPVSEPAVSNAGLESSRHVQVMYLFGLFPIQSSKIEVMPELKLFPGGQSIGVSLQTAGVMVVGQAPVLNEKGEKYFPAKEAGIEVGDIILEVDGKAVHSDQDVANAVNLGGKKNGTVQVLVNHNGQANRKTVSTSFCAETERYRIGLYVRDRVAGVGTLTFFDQNSKKYGALGHVITDADTNQRIEIADGMIFESTIYAIEKGKRGHPGEKLGTFVNDSQFQGTLEKNSTAGVFGTMNGDLDNPYYAEPIPVGWEHEIKEGPAKIYTVIQGDTIEEFDVKIERVLHHRTDSKNLIIRVTDERLLEATGGIIQGMSGSPIVQDGKIIGAVTHVFVNDSRRGYGVFIENMLKESGIMQNGQNEAA